MKKMFLNGCFNFFGKWMVVLDNSFPLHIFSVQYIHI